MENDNKRRIEHLENLKFKMEQDMRRISLTGSLLGPNDPLNRNYRTIVSELGTLKNDSGEM